jgi:hypothetical protein
MADGSMTGQWDYYYPSANLLISTFLIRFAASQPSTYLIVLMRLCLIHFRTGQMPGIEPSTSWRLIYLPNLSVYFLNSFGSVVIYFFYLLSNLFAFLIYV